MCQLAERYEELEWVDRELLSAEWNLLAAHLNFSRRKGPGPEAIFQQVLSLREKSRTLLASLGDEFVSAS